MSHLSILGLKSQQQALLDRLIQFGVMDVTFADSQQTESEAVPAVGAGISPDGADAPSAANREAVQELSTLLGRLQTALEWLGQQFPLKTGLFSSRTPVDRASFFNMAAREHEVLARLEQLERLQREESELHSQQDQLNQQQNLLEPWDDLELDLAVTGTARTSIVMGQANELRQFEEVKAALAETFPESSLIEVSCSERTALLLVISLREQAAEVRNLLSALDFHEFPLQGQEQRGTARSRMAENSERLEALAAAQAAVREQMAEIAAERLDFGLLHDFLAMRLERLQTGEQLTETTQTFNLNGWVPTGLVDGLAKALREEFTVALQIREPEADEAFPVRLRNNAFNEKFEVILEQFSAPDAHESDPMPLLGPFYFIIFGMMLSDVGYGLLLLIGSLILLKKFKVQDGTKKMVNMLLFAAIASIAWGFVFGGFFGDLLTTVSSGAITFPALWFNPMDNPMQLLIFSCLFGVIHLFAGMALGIRNQARNGDLIGGLLDIGPWFLIIGGLLLLAGGPAAGMAPLVGEIGKWLALAGVAVKVLFGGRDSKNPIVRLLKGVLSLYDITSYFSDILSYSRILALVLATSVIAIVVNMLGFMGGATVSGIIVFIIVAIFGHALNLALSVLSAYVHASRLQYVEFFGKFFTGGGTFWKPLAMRPKYITVRQEEPSSGSEARE